MGKKVIIIGGVAAGMSAAAKARRSNEDLTIEVYTKEKFISYAGCGLPYYISNHISNQADLIARTVEQFAKQNISVFTETNVTQINPTSKTITIQKLASSEEDTVTYDKLIIATGASSLVPPFAGVDLDGVFSLRNIPDSIAIREYLNKHKPKKAVIVGAGYIGLEVAEALLTYNMDITLVERGNHIIPNMDEDMAQIVTDYLVTKGVKVQTNEEVISFQGDERIRQIVTDQGTIDTDFVLLSIGVRPNSELAKEAGINLGARGAIQVNNKMETNIPDIYAAGDCATTNHLVSGQEVYIPMGTTANKQGRTAGENVAGGHAEFAGVLGTGITKVNDLEIARTGLSEKECQALDINYISRTIKSRNIAHFYPGSQEIWVKLIVNEDNRKLIGGQIVGYQGSAKRIDVIATAINTNATIDDLVDMDLAYAPPFSPVWDPVLVAVNQF